MTDRVQPAATTALSRLGLVVHPTRNLDLPLAGLRPWADEHEVSLVQIQVEGRERDVAPPGEPAGCDLIMAIGGDGTALAALHAAAAGGAPMVGVACGSLGALATVPAHGVPGALDRFIAGEWQSVDLPALAVTIHDGTEVLALNDMAVVRAGEGQLRTAARVDGALYARFAGDGSIVSTPLGSSAYALAAGGPLLTPATQAFLFTPISTHGGFCPPIVLAGDATLALELIPGHGGARIEIDGQVRNVWSDAMRVALRPDVAHLVSFSGREAFLYGLRQRRIIIDSPRILADDARGS